MSSEWPSGGAGESSRWRCDPAAGGQHGERLEAGADKSRRKSKPESFVVKFFLKIINFFPFFYGKHFAGTFDAFSALQAPLPSYVANPAPPGKLLCAIIFEAFIIACVIFFMPIARIGSCVSWL